MNTSMFSGLTAGDKTFFFFSIVAGIASAVFWMYVGWRAMRAPENIAESVERFRREYLVSGNNKSS